MYTITAHDRHPSNFRVFDLFEAERTCAEGRLVARFESPGGIQHFLDGLAYAALTVYRAPLRVLRERTCQCFNGVVVGTAMLRRSDILR